MGAFMPTKGAEVLGGLSCCTTV